MKSRIFALFAAVVFFTACTPKSETGPKAARQVNLAIWGNYLAPEQQRMFTEKTGIEIRVTNYSSNEELLAKLQAGASGYDVAVPSDYMVEIMSKMGLLEKLDPNQLPHFSEVSPEFLKQAYDPANEYSVPYAWSVTGIAVNRDLFKGEIKGWKDLFENKELAGKISLLDDAREAIGAALKSKGLSYNSTKPEDLKKAKDLLLEARKRVKMFRSDMIDSLVNKEVAAGQAYMVDANQAWKKTGGKVEFVLPAEGTTYAIDNLVIVKGAKNIKEAHELIDFLLQPEVNKIFVENIMAGPVLKKTMDLLPDALKKNTKLFPPKDVVLKSEKIRDLGEATRLYDEAWTEVKSN
jgi:spermidine/putrescine transport system substrate-binding protein